MGWLTFNLSGKTAKEYFIDSFKDSEGYELIDIAIKNFRTAYMVVRDKEKGYNFALIYLLHRAPKSYYNFGYKDMSEFAGPGVCDCPERILKQLTPIEEIIEKDGGDKEDSIYQWAQDWRNRCYEQINCNKVIQKALKQGKIIVSKEPIKFTSGYSYSRFKKVGKSLYAISNSGMEYRVRFNLKCFSFTIED